MNNTMEEQIQSLGVTESLFNEQTPIDMLQAVQGEADTENPPTPRLGIARLNLPMTTEGVAIKSDVF